MIDTDAYHFRGLQTANLIAEKAPTNVLVKYGNFEDVFSFTLESTNMLSNKLMPTNSLDHLSHLQVLPFLSTGCWTDP